MRLKATIDDKFWTSVIAWHWVSTFMDPTFKDLQFMPDSEKDDEDFKAKTIANAINWTKEHMSLLAGNTLGSLRFLVNY